MFRMRYRNKHYSNYLYMYVYILVICITPQEGLTALMMAVKEGHITIVNTLVKSCANINIQENVSATERSCGV